MACPACGAAAERTVEPYRASSRVFSGRKLMGCECGLVFVDPMPASAELDEYYRGSYWGERSSVNPVTRAYYRAQGLARAAFVGDVSTIGSVLDVGAGSGDLLLAFRDRGFTGRYEAVEPDVEQSKAIAAESGGEVFPDLSAVPAGKRYDLVVLSHVLEHVPDPRGLIARALGLVAPQGRLFIELPNQDHLYKADLEPHVLFFSPAALYSLLGKCGRIEKLESCGRPISTLRAERDARPSFAARLKGAVPAPAKDAVKKLLGRGGGKPAAELTRELGLESYGQDRQWLRALARPS